MALYSYGLFSCGLCSYSYGSCMPTSRPARATATLTSPTSNSCATACTSTKYGPHTHVYTHAYAHVHKRVYTHVCARVHTHVYTRARNRHVTMSPRHRITMSPRHHGAISQRRRRRCRSVPADGCGAPIDVHACSIGICSAMASARRSRL